jgi:hypothetical protein
VLFASDAVRSNLERLMSFAAASCCKFVHPVAGMFMFVDEVVGFELKRANF